jgi:hypothetical protein
MTFLSLKKGTILVEFGIRGFPEMVTADLCVIIKSMPVPAGLEKYRGELQGVKVSSGEGFVERVYFVEGNRGGFFIYNLSRLPRRGWRERGNCYSLGTFGRQ